MSQLPETSIHLRLGPRYRQQRMLRQTRHIAAAEAAQARITVELDPGFQSTQPVRVCCTIDLGAAHMDPPELRADQDGASSVSPTTPDARCPSCSQAMDRAIILELCGCIICEDCRSKRSPSRSYPNPCANRPDTHQCKAHGACGDQAVIGLKELSRTCTLCFGTDDREWAVMRTCGHTFHEECLDLWVFGAERDRECPRCSKMGDSFVGFHMP